MNKLNEFDGFFKAPSAECISEKQSVEEHICQNCEWWRSTFGQEGKCLSLKVLEDLGGEQILSPQSFGCIYWIQK